MAHIAEITAAVDLPVNVDFGSGYGADPSEVADSVERLSAQMHGLTLGTLGDFPTVALFTIHVFR
jgi:2-methylisocitrate lyase-like PEP mutase family enzyme